MPTGRIYRFCIWARLGPGARANSTNSTIIMRRGSGRYEALASGPISVSQGPMQRVCLDNLTPTSTVNYFGVYLGTVIGAWHLDDASLEFSDSAQRLAGALQSPAAAPTPRP